MFGSFPQYYERLSDLKLYKTLKGNMFMLPNSLRNSEEPRQKAFNSLPAHALRKQRG
jgi:hypothetical protein